MESKPHHPTLYDDWTARREQLAQLPDSPSGESGTLNDIGLFSDLLALPPAADEHPRERPAMLHSMWRLAGAISEPFDVSDLVGAAPSQGEETVSPLPPAAEIAQPDWKCPKCRRSVPGHFEICWNCGTTVDGVEDPSFPTTEDG